jgi:hypothetical protein
MTESVSGNQSSTGTGASTQGLDNAGHHGGAVDTNTTAGIQSQDSLTTSQPVSDTTQAERLAASPTTADRLSQANTGSVVDNVVDITSLTGAANIGFNAPINGLDLGPLQVDPMRFGRYAPNSTMPTAGYRVTQFADPGFAGLMAKQTMISSQSAFEVAKQVDPTLTSTRFEVSSPTRGANRTYDAYNSSLDRYTEVKAGKTITAGQLAKDIDLAKTGQAVDYVFTGNTLTGNHGPSAPSAQKLTDAVQQSGGHFSHRVASDIAPTSSQIDAVVSAGKFSHYMRGAGKVLGPAAAVLDGYTIYSAAKKDGWSFGENTKVAVAETAGGWAGAASLGFAGAKAGAVAGTFIGGPVGAAVGGVVGGLVGAVGGALGGSWVGNTISSWF